MCESPAIYIHVTSLTKYTKILCIVTHVPVVASMNASMITNTRIV